MYLNKKKKNTESSISEKLKTGLGTPYIKQSVMASQQMNSLNQTASNEKVDRRFYGNDFSKLDRKRYFQVKYKTREWMICMDPFHGKHTGEHNNLL